LIPSAGGERSGRISSRVGDEIRHLRKRQGMTLVELSQRAVSHTLLALPFPSCGVPRYDQRAGIVDEQAPRS
jgi:hypothetical protein